jgi:hypothetical protein
MVFILNYSVSAGSLGEDPALRSKLFILTYGSPYPASNKRGLSVPVTPRPRRSHGN